MSERDPSSSGAGGDHVDDQPDAGASGRYDAAPAAQESSEFFDDRRGGGDDGGLPPDHPLLAGAQAQLKAQLEESRNRLEGELRERREEQKARYVDTIALREWRRTARAGEGRRAPAVELAGPSGAWRASRSAIDPFNGFF